MLHANVPVSYTARRQACGHPCRALLSKVRALLPSLTVVCTWLALVLTLPRNNRWPCSLLEDAGAVVSASPKPYIERLEAPLTSSMLMLMSLAQPLYRRLAPVAEPLPTVSLL